MENIILTNNKDLRLVSVKVGVLSTLRFELPLVSASATRVEVIVTSGSVHSAYTATFIDNTKCWQCDIAASQFPAVGKQSYEIAYVLDGKQFWDGKGWIEIEDATTSGIEPQPRPEPYRYVVVSVNGYGADAQGAVRIPKTFIATNSPVTTEGYMEGDIYFNRETGATWTLCDVQGTLTWVFNYKNYYTKAETDEAIDKLAAYYITSDVQGNPFATHAALVNATTYYSGGSVRVPTRNDYAIVVADETHNNEEWRYIYAENAQGVGQWEPQYAVEGVITFDNNVTRTSGNGVKSSGIWSAIWGTLSALPTGFASLYDWVVDQLAGKASKADATLTARYGSTEAAQWTITYPQGWAHGTVYITWFDEFSPIGWVADCDGDRFGPFSDNPNATTLTGEVFGETITATRTALPGYQLGSDDQHILASEAEAEALRTAVAAKQDALSTQQLANIEAVPGKLDKSGGTMTGSLVVTGLNATVGVSDGTIIATLTPTMITVLKPSSGSFPLIYNFAFPDGSGTLALTSDIPDVSGLASKAANPTAGNLAALDSQGNPTDSLIPAANVALKGEIPYSLGTPIVIDEASSETVEGETVNYGAATLANRTANIVQVTAATALDELRITFPAATSGKVRDFGLRVEIGTGSAALAAPALVPIGSTGETIKIENNAAEIPALAGGTATAKGVTLLYFSENAPGVFIVKGEQVEEVA